jgi:antitoxin ParD1/3/4
MRFPPKTDKANYPASLCLIGNNCQSWYSWEWGIAAISIMPTRNVNLTEHFDRFIETGITSGRYSNASEVVREGLRLLEQREQEDKAKIDWLRSAAKEGFDQLDRGEGIEFASMDDFDVFIDQIGTEVSAQIAAERKRG